MRNRNAAGAPLPRSVNHAGRGVATAAAVAICLAQHGLVHAPATPKPALFASSPRAPASIVAATEKTWLERWAPVVGNGASVLTTLFAVGAGVLGFRKYFGSEPFEPYLWIEVSGTIASLPWKRCAIVVVSLENKGIRSVWVHGDPTPWEPSTVYGSYVCTYPARHDELAAPDFAWEGRGTTYALDQQTRNLFVEGSAPTGRTRSYSVKLGPAFKTVLPFAIPLPEDTVAALVRAQIYVETYKHKKGNRQMAEVIVT